MTTTPCVSPATGTLRPDERVHYAYGMVLGLDEFLQEQVYTLSKDHLHHRALHGFGTVSGLAVSVGPAEGDAADRQVTVSTGIGCDQWGREFVIDCSQCARVGAWVVAQASGHAADVPDTADTGAFPVYVVATYDECLERPIPIPGQPCATSDQAIDYSRTRDAWNVQLRWTPPTMPRWDSDRRLARVLSQVVVVQGLDHASSDEAAIIAAVQALAARAGEGPGSLDPQGSPAPTWRLPAAEAADAVDRILTVWVTQVRPVLDLPLGTGDGDSDPAVLLATLDVTLDTADGIDLTHPRITDCVARDDGRPYLLHTQLIGELRSFGTDLEVEPPIQFSTLTAASDLQGNTTIDAWFHLPSPVKLPATLTVTDEDGSKNAFATQPVPAESEFSYVWRLLSPTAGASSRDGLQVTVAFPATSVLVGDAATTLGDVEAQGRSFINQADNGDLVGYAEVRAAVPPAATTVVAVPNAEFVSIETVSINDARRIVELWFHLQPRGTVDDTVALEPAFTVYDDTNGDDLPVTLSGPAPWSRNVWRIAIKAGLQEGREQYLRFVFSTSKFLVEASGEKLKLADWIEKAGLTYVGQHPDREAVVCFHHVDLPAEFNVKFPEMFDEQTDLPTIPTPPIVGPPIFLPPVLTQPPVVTLPPVNPGPLSPGPIVATPIVIGPVLPHAVTSTVLLNPVVTPPVSDAGEALPDAADTKAAKVAAAKTAIKSPTKAATSKTATSKTAPTHAASEAATAKTTTKKTTATKKAPATQNVAATKKSATKKAGDSQ